MLLRLWNVVENFIVTTKIMSVKIAKTEAMAEQWGGSTEKGGAE